MLTILWNPHGFHVLTMLPKGALFNAAWFLDQNSVHLVARFYHRGRTSGQRKLVLHIDNAPGHRAKMTQNFCEHNPLKRLVHTPYSPDISPSDFYRFGKVKGVLIGQEIPDEIELLDAVTEILNGISSAELQAVFQDWIERVRGVIDADSGYASW
jgi:histone-lysine N-methyltransferase SETMAR